MFMLVTTTNTIPAQANEGSPHILRRCSNYIQQPGHYLCIYGKYSYYIPTTPIRIWGRKRKNFFPISRRTCGISIPL